MVTHYLFGGSIRFSFNIRPLGCIEVPLKIFQDHEQLGLQPNATKGLVDENAARVGIVKTELNKKCRTTLQLHKVRSQHQYDHKTTKNYIFIDIWTHAKSGLPDRVEINRNSSFQQRGYPWSHRNGLPSRWLSPLVGVEHGKL